MLIFTCLFMSMLNSSPLKYRVDFAKILQTFDLKMTLDETNLLFMLIYRAFGENSVTVGCIMEWLKVVL